MFEVKGEQTIVLRGRAKVIVHVTAKHHGDRARRRRSEKSPVDAVEVRCNKWCL